MSLSRHRQEHPQSDSGRLRNPAAKGTLGRDVHAVSWPGNKAREGTRHRNGEESHILSPIYAFRAEPLLLQVQTRVHMSRRLPRDPRTPRAERGGRPTRFEPFGPTAQAPTSCEDAVALPASVAAPSLLSTAHSPHPCLGHLPVLSTARGPRPSRAAPPQARGSRRATSNMALPRSAAHGRGSCRLSVLARGGSW